MASVPVRATAPAAKARKQEDDRQRLERPFGLLQDLVGVAAALAQDDDPERPDGDHQQRREDEQVGRDREDVAGLAQAAQVADGDQADRADPDDHAPIEQRREGRDDLLDRRRGRHRDRQDVVDEQRRGRDERDPLADVPAGDRVRAATGRVGDADLAVADRDHDQQAADQDADLEPVGEGDDAAEDQDPQDLFGGVGRRRDGVRAEDRQRLLLRQALAELVLARERAPEQEPAERGEGLAGGRRRGAGRFLGGQLALAGVAEVRGVRPFDPNPAVARLAALQWLPSADHQAPTRKRSARRPGRPAARIVAPTASKSYTARPQVAVAGDGVEDQVAGARVAVARLADAARVEQRPALTQRDRVAGPRRERPHPPVDLGEGDRDVGVTVQAVTGGDGRQAGPGERRGRDVLPGRVARAAVDEREVRLHPALGEGRQPGPRRLGDVGLRPLQGGRGLRVEPREVDRAGRGGIVIAADAGRPERASAARRPRRVPARSRRRRRGARWHRPLRCWRGRRRAPRCCCGYRRARRCAQERI